MGDEGKRNVWIRTCLIMPSDWIPCCINVHELRPDVAEIWLMSIQPDRIWPKLTDVGPELARCRPMWSNSVHNKPTSGKMWPKSHRCQFGRNRPNCRTWPTDLLASPRNFAMQHEQQHLCTFCSEKLSENLRAGSPVRVRWARASGRSSPTFGQLPSLRPSRSPCLITFTYVGMARRANSRATRSAVFGQLPSLRPSGSP